MTSMFYSVVALLFWGCPSRILIDINNLLISLIELILKFNSIHIQNLATVTNAKQRHLLACPKILSLSY